MLPGGRLVSLPPNPIAFPLRPPPDQDTMSPPSQSSFPAHPTWFTDTTKNSHLVVNPGPVPYYSNGARAKIPVVLPSGIHLHLSKNRSSQGPRALPYELGAIHIIVRRIPCHLLLEKLTVPIGRQKRIHELLVQLFLGDTTRSDRTHFLLAYPGYAPRSCPSSGKSHSSPHRSKGPAFAGTYEQCRDHIHQFLR